jgi:hypothetical protein
VDLYKDQLKKPYSSVVDCDFDGYFDQQVKELEGLADKGVLKAPEVFLGDLTPPSSSDNGHDEPPPVPGLLPGTVMKSSMQIMNILIVSPFRSTASIGQQRRFNRRNANPYPR